MRAPLAPSVMDEVVAWAQTPGGRRFCDALRVRLWRNGKLKNRLAIPAVTEDEWADVLDLFGWDACSRRGMVRLDLADHQLRSSRLRIGLRRLLIEADGNIISRRGHARYQRIKKRLDVVGRRRTLLAETSGTPELDSEYRLLAALGDEDKYIVPAGTASRTQSWKTYESALRVASLYYERAREGKRIPEKSLPATALGGSKVWTDASKLAFQNLIGKPFNEAVEVTDQPIQLRGPLTWRVDDVDVAKALPSKPWISIPLRALLSANAMSTQPNGVLLIENHTNFEQVCKHAEVHQRWLVVWLEGFPSDAQARFLRRFPSVPVAAWCDMDPPGIEIIGKLEQKAGRRIAAIGMEVDLWLAASKFKASPADRERCREQAARIKPITPPSLLGLLDCFRETGERVEQEELSVYDEVLANLPRTLRELEGQNRGPSWSKP